MLVDVDVDVVVDEDNVLVDSVEIRVVKSMVDVVSVISVVGSVISVESIVDVGGGNIVVAPSPKNADQINAD